MIFVWLSGLIAGVLIVGLVGTAVHWLRRPRAYQIDSPHIALRFLPKEKEAKK